MRALLEHGFTRAQVAAGEVGLEDALLLMREQDKLIEQYDAACERLNDGVHGYLSDAEDWD